VNREYVKRCGFFAGTVFLVAYFGTSLLRVFGRGSSFVQAFLIPGQLAQLLISALMYASAYIYALRWIPPVIYLAIMPLGFIGTHESFYGIGLFAVACILLFRLGFFDRHRLLKVGLCIVYLFICEIIAALIVRRSFVLVLTSTFLALVFIIFLYLIFYDRLVVYLKKPKPRFSMVEAGLSSAERYYVKSVVAGKSLKEISYEFEVSESTVRNTLSRAYKKLGVDDIIGLVNLAGQKELAD
jgi:DNA-binding CsgD family transcriptional regulator